MGANGNFKEGEDCRRSVFMAPGLGLDLNYEFFSQILLQKLFVSFGPLMRIFWRNIFGLPTLLSIGWKENVSWPHSGKVDFSRCNILDRSLLPAFTFKTRNQDSRFLRSVSFGYCN